MCTLALARIIKLLPKEGDLGWLSNWRPITMLHMTYTILSKILANRLKPLIPSLVENQQTSFVHSCSITNNLLAFRMGKD